MRIRLIQYLFNLKLKMIKDHKDRKFRDTCDTVVRKYFESY